MKKIITIFLLTLSLSVFANDERESAIDSIIAKTEVFIIEKVEEVVDDRYDWISSPRVWLDVIISSDKSRKEDWEECFKESCISKDSIQFFINKQIEQFNSTHSKKLKKVCIAEIRAVDDASFDLIVKRERNELFCWFGSLILSLTLALIIVYITDFFIQNVIAEKLPLPIVLLINIVSLAVIIYLANQYLIPLETDISNSIIQNVFQQVSNMNIFEQL